MCVSSLFINFQFGARSSDKLDAEGTHGLNPLQINSPSDTLRTEENPAVSARTLESRGEEVQFNDSRISVK
jgi:hypothetical protein